MLVFVYGTLKKGQGNYFRLLHDKPGVRFVDEAVTVNKYSMKVSGIPYVSKKDKTHAVKITGHVFEVEYDTLKRLDMLEGHPEWYYREKIHVKCKNGAIVSAYIYFNEEGRGFYSQSGIYE